MAKMYKTQLSEIELATIDNNIYFKEAKRKAQSILSYLKKHINLNCGSWSQSTEKIHAMYVRYHEEMSDRHLRRIIKRLIELGLVCVEKIQNRNVYSLPADPIVEEECPEFCPELCPESNSNITIGITSIDEHDKKPNYKPLTRSINDIDINSFANGNENINLKHYTFGEVLFARNEVFEEMNVNNNWIRNRITVILGYVYKRIRSPKAFIRKLVNQAREISEANYRNTIIRDIYTQNAINKVKVNHIKGVPANFTQREYDYKLLEQQLLGWE